MILSWTWHCSTHVTSHKRCRQLQARILYKLDREKHAYYIYWLQPSLRPMLKVDRLIWAIKHNYAYEKKHLLWKLFCVSLTSWKHVSLLHSLAFILSVRENTTSPLHGGVKLLSVAQNSRSGWCWVCSVRCLARVRAILWRL